MASGPITSWEIDGETVETVSDCIFLGSKITADGDCSHEIIPQHKPLGAGFHERHASTHTTFLLGSHCYKRMVMLVCAVCTGASGEGGGEPVRESVKGSL